MSDDLDWHRLAAAVTARRNELRMSQSDVRAIGGPSTPTLGKIESAHVKSIKPFTKIALEDALRWTRGSVDAILASGIPTLALPAGTSGRVEVLHEENGERILIDIVDGVGELSNA